MASSSSSKSGSSKSSASKKDSKTYESGRTKRGGMTDDNGWGGFGGYMQAKKQKLSDQFVIDKQENHSNVFEGVRIYVNGYTKPSSDELRRLMQKHGGKYEMYLSKSRVTHIVATNLPNSKLHQAKTMPVVKPEWITDSVAAGKKLPHTDYLLIGSQSRLQFGAKYIEFRSSLCAASSTISSLTEDVSSSDFTRVKDKGSLNKESSPLEVDKEEEDITIQEHSLNSSDNQRHLHFNLHQLNENDSQCLHENLMKQEETPKKDAKFVAKTISENIFHDTLNEDVGTRSSGEDSDIIYGSEEEYSSPIKLDLIKSSIRSKMKMKNSPLILDSLPSETGNQDFSKERTDNEDANNFPGHTDDGINENDIPYCESSTHVNAREKNGQALGDTCNVEGNFDANQSENIDSNPCDCQDVKDGRAMSSTHSLPSPHKATAVPSSSTAKAGDKHFLSEFYSNSRLHHLSTWGAEFKAYVAEIQKSKSDSVPGRERLRQVHVDNVSRLGMVDTLESARHSSHERTVMHIDMDCFFVSVGLLARPDLRGKPVAVTHSRGQGSKPSAGSDAAWEKAEWQKKRDGRLKTQTSPSGMKSGSEYDRLIPEGSSGTQTFYSMAEIASCSYEARQKGVKNGMFMGRARSLCPELQTILYNFDEYNRISRILYDTVASYTHDIEAVSCDEMLLDCTDLLADTGATAMEFATLLRQEMMDKTGCSASTGIGPSILLAKLATRRAKPNGQFQVLSCDAKTFIKDQDISNIPGVGYSMTRKLSKLGVKTCGDLQVVPVSRLRTEFGPKTGESLHQYSFGRDDREVKGDKQRKSVSAEVNYGIRFTKEPEAFTFLQELAMEVQQRLSKLKVKGQCITLKLMVRCPDAPQKTAKFMGHGICNTFNKSTNLPVATNDGSLIGREVIAMYKSHNVSAVDVRGIGIQIQKLEAEDAKGYSHGKQLSGHQSILNFAVAGKEHMTPSTSVTSPSKKISSSSLHSTTGLNNVGFGVSRRRNLDSVTSVMEKDNGNSSSSHSHHVELTLDSGESSNFLGRGGHVTNTSKNQAGTNAFFPDEIDLNALTDVSFLLSPSQVNTDVLKELPDDIASEIRAGMEQHERNKYPCGVSSSSSSVPVQGTCSSSLNPGLENKLGPSGSTKSCIDSNSTSTGPSNVKRKDSSDAVTDLPSMSQVDFGCFQALPKHLQMELQAAYAKQRKSHDAGDQRSTLMNTALGKLKSPSKDMKGKQSKSGKRRGRPPRKKKITYVDQTTYKTSPVKRKLSKSSMEESVDSDVDIIVLDDQEILPKIPEKDQATSHQDIGPDGTAVFSAVESPTAKDASSDTSMISFCGAKSAFEVRNLLKEWLNSTESPREDDITMFTDYLISLVKARCLEQAFCHLRFLIRRVRSSPNLALWGESVDSIAVHVQSYVWDLYGSHFKLM